MKQVLLVVAIALTLGACSNASEFTPSIKRFAAATEKAETGFAELDQAAAKRATERRRQLALANPARIQRDGCRHGDRKCELQMLEDGKPIPLQVATFAREQRQAFEAITAYAKALESVATADATKEVKAATDQAAVAITALAAVVPGAAPAAPFVMPIGRLVTWVYGQYQEYIKLDALRHATGEMQPVMEQATRIFRTTAETAAEREQVGARAPFDASFDSFRDPNVKGDKAAALELLMARRAGLHAAMTLRPDDVFIAMNEAHSSLTEALRQDDITVADAAKKLQSFAAQAEALFAIATDLQKAGGSN